MPLNIDKNELVLQKSTTVQSSLTMLSFQSQPTINKNNQIKDNDILLENVNDKKIMEISNESTFKEQDS